MKRIPNKNAFTLIELLVVIAVLGILAGGVLVAISPLKRINQANDAKVKSDIGQIAQSSQAYFIQNLSYPRTVAQLVTNRDLKVAPKQPKTNSDYEITPTPADCDGTSTNPCTDITVEGTLLAPQTPNGTYKWDSTTNQAGEAAAPTPTPTTTPVPPTSTPSPTPDPGLLAYWKFDAGAGSVIADTSPNGVNGAWGPTGNPNWTTGKYGSGLLFNGAYVGASPSKTNRKFVTVEGWVNFSDPDSINKVDRYHWLFGWNYEFNAVFRTYTSEPGPGYFIWVQGTTISGGTNNISFVYSFSSQVSSWHYVTMTYDGSTAKLYFDANLVSQQTISSTGIADLGRGFSIGGNTEASAYFDGVIDEVKVYNYARTQAQITQDMLGQ